MGSIYRPKNRKTWMLRYKSLGKWQRESSHTSVRSEAKRLLALKMGDVAKGMPVSSKMGRLRFEEAVADLIAYHTARGKETKKLEGRVRKHLSRKFADCKMIDITAADIDGYAAMRTREHSAPANTNQELGLLRQMFRRALRNGKLATIPHVELLPVSNTRTGFFERQQYEAVLKALPAAIKPVIVVAYWTGWRIKSEVLPLKWDQVKDGWLRLEPGTTKNKEGRMFPFADNPELVAALEDARRLTKPGVFCPFVFHRNGKRITSIRKVFKTAVVAAGCPLLRPHDFRRTAVRNFERQGVSRSAAMRLVGHKTEQIYRRYAIVSESDLREAVQKSATVCHRSTEKVEKDVQELKVP